MVLLYIYLAPSCKCNSSASLLGGEAPIDHRFSVGHALSRESYRPYSRQACTHLLTQSFEVSNEVELVACIVDTIKEFINMSH